MKTKRGFQCIIENNQDVFTRKKDDCLRRQFGNSRISLSPEVNRRSDMIPIEGSIVIAAALKSFIYIIYAYFAHLHTKRSASGAGPRVTESRC